MAADLELGAFSVSLSVQDLAASRTFYEALGFEVIGGAPDHHFLILRNGAATLGLFHGMFEGNVLTFNPGWTPEGTDVDGAFTDVRDLQRTLAERGIEVVEAAAEGTGPAHFTLTDPDGNAILVDQHRDAPA